MQQIRLHTILRFDLQRTKNAPQASNAAVIGSGTVTKVIVKGSDSAKPVVPVSIAAKVAVIISPGPYAHAQKLMW
jgi:hypothetical protein